MRVWFWAAVVVILCPPFAMAKPSGEKIIETLQKQLCLHPSKSTDSIEDALRSRATSIDQKKRELLFLENFADRYGVRLANSSSESLTDLRSSLKSSREDLKDNQKRLSELQEKAAHQGPLLRIYQTLNAEKKLSASDLAYMQALIKKKVDKIDAKLMPLKNKNSEVEHKIKALRTSTKWEDRDQADALEEKLNNQDSAEEITELSNKKKDFTYYLAWLVKGNNGSGPRTDLFDDVDTSSSSEDYQSSIKSYQKDIKGNLQEISRLESKINSLAKPGEPSNAMITKFKQYQDAIIAHGVTVDNPGFQICDMTASEIVSIQVYTRNGYKDLNSALRAESKIETSDRAFQATLSSALHKLRPFHGDVLRGTDLTDKVRTKFVPGAVITLKAFTSTSVTEPFSGTDQIIIHSKTGRYIAPFSNSYSEQEVLFDAGTKFRVVSNKSDGSQYKIVLDEIVGSQ